MPRFFSTLFLVSVLGQACTSPGPNPSPKKEGILPCTQFSTRMDEKIVKPDSEWEKQLTPFEFQVTRKKGTERAFTGAFWDHHAKGTYQCVCCGQDLFPSDSKFDSGSGWPSFFQPVDECSVQKNSDLSHGMARVEVVCSRCDAHLGHVFEDGPKPTGLRYCINSASLRFSPNP